MIVELVYDNVDGKLTIPSVILPDGQDKPFDHHFTSTPMDNLVELAGRLCYDSAKQFKSRTSEAYHAHINEVNHGSTQEHAVMCFRVICLPEQFGLFVDRPGTKIINLHTKEVFGRPRMVFTLTANARAIREWWTHGYVIDNNDAIFLCDYLFGVATRRAPLIFKDKQVLPVKVDSKLLIHETVPDCMDTIWASLFISGISRNASHELVRHKYQTAVSQRSTRFVQESDSDIIWHPLLTNAVTEVAKLNDLEQSYLYCGALRNSNKLADSARTLYKEQVDLLEKWLTDKGTDKLTARKQARGAARAVLPSALSTELIFSASLKQWQHMIRMRANRHADGEIRLLFNTVYSILSKRFPSYFEGWSTAPCPDGIGYEVLC